jgi:hypothetical protein
MLQLMCFHQDWASSNIHPNYNVPQWLLVITRTQVADGSHSTLLPTCTGYLGYPFQNRTVNSTVSNRLALCSMYHWSEKELDSCAGYLGHPFKKQAHGDESAGFTLLAGGLIPEGTSGRTACARWLCTSLSSAKQELHERSHLGNQPIVRTDVRSRQYTVRCCRSFALSGGNKSPTPL